MGRKTLDERFWAKVHKTDSCWVWQGGTTPAGYGLIYAPQGSSRLKAAHRVAYELEIGPIPQGMEIDHICRRRNCVNPDHLRTATRSQNLQNTSRYVNSKSGHRGVVWDRHCNRWVARVKHRGRSIYVGRFTDPEMARRAVVEKRKQLFTHNEDDR
jgi:hypothetical protein